MLFDDLYPHAPRGESHYTPWGKIVAQREAEDCPLCGRESRWRTLYMFQHACSESCLREMAAQMDEEAVQG